MFRFRSSSHTSIIQSIFIEYTLGSIPPPWIPVTSRIIFLLVSLHFHCYWEGFHIPKFWKTCPVGACLFPLECRSFLGLKKYQFHTKTCCHVLGKHLSFNPGIMEVLRHLPTADKLIKSSPEPPLKLESHFGGFQFHVQKTPPTWCRLRHIHP